MKIKRSIAISDSGFVFDASNGDSYTLNPLGAEILDCIRSGKQEPEITSLLLDKYEVDQSTIERYLYDFLFTLRQMQIIEDNG